MNNNPYSHMDKEAHRVAYLIAGYIRNTLSNAEHVELDDWVNANDRNMKLFEDLTDEKNIEANLAMMERTQSEQIFRELQQGGRFEKPKRRKMGLVWMSAAAMFIILLVVFAVWRTANSSSSPNKKPPIVKRDILQPGGNKATLTLPDGSIIDLADAKNGPLPTAAALNISKQDDEVLIYPQESDGKNVEAIHMLTTPVGGQFQVTLNDNTKVWLNAESTLRYPAAFHSNERRVELSGEAYFEVAHNAKAPFKVVLADSDTVAVLGTHFNVQAYPKEKEKTITLVEGKVLVQNDRHKAVLAPGMQAVIQDDTIATATNIDIEEATGWKEGLFVFHDAPIEQIMTQVARWYNAKIVYQGDFKQQFNATISRGEPLEKLLRLLQLNGYVKFKTENNIIYVLP
ncbi:MAG: FecR domain-containing protein [Chitinophagaceae bacterium]|nr:FecR domain-containing protein [Chitinophagaceae bacterium]